VVRVGVVVVVAVVVVVSGEWFGHVWLFVELNMIGHMTFDVC
jgi:hypothetical protein